MPGLYLSKNVPCAPGAPSAHRDFFYPLQISQLKSATYKESKKGRFRSLFLHDTGISFMDIHTSRTKADQIVTQLLKLNPEIEIKHANYL